MSSIPEESTGETASVPVVKVVEAPIEKETSATLNRGIGIIIDENINNKDSGDRILEIAQELRKKGIPYCTFESLKEARLCLSNFLELNFLILDWQLNVPEGAPKDLKDSNAKENVKFIEEFRKATFAPVFIFSSLAEKDIEDYFKRFGDKLYNNSEPVRNFILIKQKADVVGENLLKAIDAWVLSNPSVYTIKKWNREFLEAKNKTFWHLFDKSPAWPKILWDTYSKDSVDESLGLSETLTRNVISRMDAADFNKADLTSYPGKIDVSEIREVIQGVMFVDQESLSEKDLQPGDIFKVSGDYYLNIRPICDTVIGRMKGNYEPSDHCDGEFYAIKGSKLKPKDVQARYNEGLEMLNEQANEVILYGVDGKEFFRFSFKKIYSFGYSKEKDKRIARLVSPYINHVQQKYSSYVGRFGLPRIPIDIISSHLQAKAS